MPISLTLFYLAFFTHKYICMYICRTIVSFPNNPGEFNAPKFSLCDNISERGGKTLVSLPYIHIKMLPHVVIKHIYSFLILLNLIQHLTYIWPSINLALILVYTNLEQPKILFEDAYVQPLMLLGYICELGNCCPANLEDIYHPSLSTPKFNAYTFISTVLTIIMKDFIHLLSVSFLLLE